MTTPDRTIIKLRITADNEEAATRAVTLIEAALSKYGCKIARPRQGSNPKYANDPKYLAYGDMVIAGPPKKRRSTPTAPATKRKSVATPNTPTGSDSTKGS